jgi:hypothetical protein
MRGPRTTGGLDPDDEEEAAAGAPGADQGEAARRAREQVAAAEQVRDADADAVALAQYSRTSRTRRCRTSRSGPSSTASAGRSRATSTLSELAEIAESSAPLRANVAIGSFMGIDDVVAMTGRALNAAPGRRTGPRRPDRVPRDRADARPADELA